MMQPFRGSLAKFIWTAVIVIALADLLLYIKRKNVTETALYMDLPSNPREQRGKQEVGETSKHAPIERNYTSGSGLDCRAHAPCSYPEEVDFRVIVITYNRAASLRKLLDTLDQLELDGDVGMVDIWVDRGKTGKVDAKTVAVAKDFQWTKGKSRAHVWDEHVGIYGQWIETWRPRENTKEIAVILEDDLSISPYTYRWLKAARDHYGGRGDIAGYTLQSEGVNRAAGGGGLPRPEGDMALLYLLLGSWGFAPHPRAWREFQDWYFKVKTDKAFHPYVNGIVMTSWYKSFEKKKTQDSMWTMWFIYYCDKYKLFTVYNNIGKAGDVKNSFLAQNRQEPGLHFGGKGVKATKVLQKWDAKYVKFPENTKKLGFNGKPVP